MHGGGPRPLQFVEREQHFGPRLVGKGEQGIGRRLRGEVEPDRRGADLTGRRPQREGGEQQQT